MGKENISTMMSEDDREELDLKVLYVIQLCLTDEVLREVAYDVFVVGLWLKLESLYMTKSFTNKLYFKQYLYTMRMKECRSLEAHFYEFNKIIVNLKNINIKIDDEDQVIIVLCSLPASYGHFITSLLYGKDTISMENI